MSACTIGEAARRSGFSASALRYYERVGLVAPSGRSAAGYRLYDDDAMQRLVFLARAKDLGCTLEEITGLVAIWDGERCAEVQHRFHGIVTRRMLDVEARRAELASFTDELQRAAEQLGREPVEETCGPRCACITDVADPPAEVPIACTLEPGALAGRLGDWTTLLAAATRRMPIEGGVRIELARDADLAELGRLVAAERQCCAFFSFTLRVDASGVVLEVRAPPDAAAIVADVFGAAG